MYSREMLITPELAKEWLEKYNTNNRNIRLSVVRKYADDMRGGRWQLNGEAIEISRSGVLKNGQHRLYAVIEAGVPVVLYVTFDVPDEASIYDMQAKRSLADVSRLKGSNITSKYVALGRFVYEYLAGMGYARFGEMHLLDFLEGEFTTLESAINSVGSDHESISRRVPCYTAAWVYIVNGCNVSLLERFFKVANSGYYNEGEEAAIAFRNMILARIKLFNTHAGKRDLFRATSKAIYDFSLKKPRKKIYCNSDFDSFDFYTGTNAEIIVNKYRK